MTTGGAAHAAAGLAHAQAKVTEWERKLKHGQTALKGWRAKVRYYARRTLALSAAEGVHDARAAL